MLCYFTLSVLRGITDLALAHCLRSFFLQLAIRRLNRKGCQKMCPPRLHLLRLIFIMVKA